MQVQDSSRQFWKWIWPTRQKCSKIDVTLLEMPFPGIKNPSQVAAFSSLFVFKQTVCKYPASLTINSQPDVAHARVKSYLIHLLQQAELFRMTTLLICTGRVSQDILQLIGYQVLHTQISCFLVHLQESRSA